MIRRIIHIDEEKCNGCGICVRACHEGAIELSGGKARLTRDDYCDGLGDCLPTCPTGAITFVEREAAAYDQEAVKKNIAAGKASSGCPGRHAAALKRDPADAEADRHSYPYLSHWPVQIRLAPVKAPYFSGCALLIAADCTAYAYGAFHRDFMKDHVTLIGCPKLDGIDYSEKLSEIFSLNDIKSVTLARMTVPCCGGMETAIRRAIERSGRDIPFDVSVISPDGRIIER